MSSSYHRPLRVGTRGSPLALAQAGRIARQLREQCGRLAVLVTVATPGDESTAPIEQLGTTGVFTTTLREALLHGDVDLVVHSCKDLPTAPVPGRADRHRVTPAGRPAPRRRPPPGDRADPR